MNICALCCQYEYATAGQNKVNNQYIWHSDHFLLFSSHVLQGMKTDDKWLLAMHLLRWVSLLLQVHKLWSLISSADFYHISCQNIQLQVKTSKLSLFGMQTIFIFCFFFSSHVLQKNHMLWMHLLRWVSLLLQIHKLWSLNITSADFYHISCRIVHIVHATNATWSLLSSLH